MATFVGLRLVAFTTAFACCGAVHAQTPTGFAAKAVPVSAGADDMAMPDDLGAPLPPVSQAAAAADDMAVPDDLGAPLSAAPSAHDGSSPASVPIVLSVDMPIARIAANPKGKAVLEHALPGLCERVEYPMFKGMSLTRLAGMSSGRITTATLDSVQADLARIGPVGDEAAASHGAFYPLTHTAVYSIRYGGRQIGHISRALYHRVALVIAAM